MKKFEIDDSKDIGPFLVNEAGVYYYEDRENPIWLSSKLKVVALTCNHLNENWGRVLEFKDSDGLIHHWDMPDYWSQSKIISNLLKQGLEIAFDPKKRKYLFEYIMNHR